MSTIVLDLSHHNAVVDFDKVRKAGTLGVILKATQGSGYKDPTFVSRARAAHRAGLVVGAYHFADGATPSSQIKNFMSVAGTIPLLALDFEFNPQSVRAEQNMAVMTAGTVTTAQMGSLVMLLEAAAGQKPVVYTGRFGPSQTGKEFPDGLLNACPLWLAQFRSGLSPALPSGWDKWTLWQFSETGSVDGVFEDDGVTPGQVDLNRFNGSTTELYQFWRTGVR